MRSSCRSLWRRLQPTGAAWNTLESSFLPPWLACSSPSSAALLPTALSPPSSPAAPFHASAAAPTAAAPSPPLGRSDAPPDQGGGPSLSSLASLFPHIQQQLAGAYQEGARERLTKLLEAAAQRNPSIHSGARSDSGSRSGPPLDPENPAHLALLGADDLLEVAADCALDSQGVALPLDSAEDLAAALAAMLREQRAARSGPAAAQQRAREAEARGEAGGRASRRAFKGLDGQQGHRTAPPLARLEEEEEQGAEGVIDAVQQAADRLFDAELAERLQRAAASRGGVPAPNLAVSSSSAAAAPPATAVAATTPLPSVDVDAAAAAGVASDNGSKRSSSSSVVVYTTPQPPLDQLPLVSAPATAAVARQYGLRNSRSTPLFISDPVDPFAPLPDVAVYRGKARARLDRLLMRSNTRQRADKQPHDAADVGALMLLKRSELADLAVDCEWGRADMGKEQLAKCISAALLQQEGGTAAGRVWVQASEVAAENAAALEKAARRKKKLLMLLPAEDGDGQSGNGAGGSGEGDGSAGHAAAWQGRQPGASGGERGGGPQAGERFVMQDPMGRTGYRQRVFEVPAEAFSALPLQLATGSQAMDDLTKAMGNSRRAAVLQAARQRKEVLAAVVDARETAQWLLKARAIDVCVIDVSDTSTHVQQLVMATGLSKRHVLAVAEAVRHRMRDKAMAWQQQRDQERDQEREQDQPGSGSGSAEEEAAARQREDQLRYLGPELLAPGGPQDWVSLDAGLVLVHVMTSEARRYYDLEGAWVGDQAWRVEHFQSSAPKVNRLDTLRVEEEI